MYVGQEEQSPEEAAAQAAYDSAVETDYPPDRDDVGRVGGAAGGAAAGAACIAYGAAVAAPLCSAIGSAIGEYVTTAIYDIFDGLFAEEYVEPQFDHVIYQRTRRAAIRLANKRNGTRTPTQEEANDELEGLERWGVPAATLAAGPGPTEAERGPWRPFFNREGLDAYLGKLVAAESALASAIITAQKLGSPKITLVSPKRLKSDGASVMTIAVAAAGVGGAIWLLASLL